MKAFRLGVLGLAVLGLILSPAMVPGAAAGKEIDGRELVVREFDADTGEEIFAGDDADGFAIESARTGKRWERDNIRVYHYGDPNHSYLSQHAAMKWTMVPRSPRMAYEGRPGQNCHDRIDGAFVVCVIPKPGGSVLGEMWFWTRDVDGEGKRTIIAVKVWFYATDLAIEDQIEVMLHEFGHGLGLPHISGPGTVMNAFGVQGLTEPGPVDEREISQRYEGGQAKQSKKDRREDRRERREERRDDRRDRRN